MTISRTRSGEWSGDGNASPHSVGDVLPRASEQNGEYPRPQLVRQRWADLDGPWSFRFDDSDVGLEYSWHTSPAWQADDGATRIVLVPFPPESRASGIGDTGYHPIVWYQRRITFSDLREAGYTAPGGPASNVSDGARATLLAAHTRVLLYFGAVDYRCTVWLDGEVIGTHTGGHTPFTCDMTNVIRRAAHRVRADELGLDLIVRAEDNPHDLDQPRGKQDWQRTPHSVWYHRTTGIWQKVWLEAVPSQSISRVHWVPNIPTQSVDVSIELRGFAAEGASVHVRATDGDTPLGSVTVPVDASAQTVTATLGLTALRNGQGYENLIWSPEHPHLIDTIVELRHADGTVIDAAASYFGLRSVGVENQHFLLNDRPYYVRAVLSQGYWPDSFLASPSALALRREVELIKELGFNTTRVHQKIEDPRFLFWADRLGLLVWEEAPSAFAFSRRSIDLLMHEWMEAVQRDLSHPSIVTWVPVNESWGVQHIAHVPAQRSYAAALASVTRALDPTRPVVSNDGWEHVDSDIITIHDYEPSGAVLATTYADDSARERLVAGIGPAGRRVLVDTTHAQRDKPVMLSEFGGVRYELTHADTSAWGYSTASDASDFAARLSDLLHGVRISSFLAGFCYTQLTDTEQEANGLLTAQREPKLPIEQLRALIVGADPATAT